jgi:amino acid efflux transporter
MAVYSVFVMSIGELQPVILVHTSIAASVYGVGVASAIVLLPRWSVGWWMAVASSLFAAGLLVLAGGNLVYPLGIALVAVLVGAIIRRRARSGAPRRRVDASAASVSAASVSAASGSAASVSAPSPPAVSSDESCEAADRAAGALSAERP